MKEAQVMRGRKDPSKLWSVGYTTPSIPPSEQSSIIAERPISRPNSSNSERMKEFIRTGSAGKSHLARIARVRAEKDENEVNEPTAERLTLSTSLPASNSESITVPHDYYDSFARKSRSGTPTSNQVPSKKSYPWTRKEKTENDSSNVWGPEAKVYIDLLYVRVMNF